MNLGYSRFIAGITAVVTAVWVGLGEQWGAVGLGAAGTLVVTFEVVAARGRRRP